MSTEHEDPRPATGRDTTPSSSPVTEAISADRRRAILRGLSKGAAIAGASVPLQSLAGQRLKLKKSGTDYVCSVSGQMSVLMSAGATNVTQCVVTNPCSYFTTPTNWPDRDANNNPGCKVGAGFWKPGDTFKSCFNATSTTATSRTCATILSSYPGTDEAYWLLAVLNARKYNSTNYPYTPEEVYAQYGSTAAASALALHKSIATGV